MAFKANLTVKRDCANTPSRSPLPQRCVANTPMHTRVPYDANYTALVGTAVYVFAYYEWVIIYLIQQYKSGFVGSYCRGSPMTSGAVRRKLEAVLTDQQTKYAVVSKEQLQACHDQFARLVEKRNALIHAHPITDHDGSQILSYQAHVDRPLPDMKWPVAEVEAAIREFEAAACDANALLHCLLK